MQEHHYQLIGLIGFILAGLIFVAVGIRSGDVLTVVGSAVLLGACIIWLIPVGRSSRDWAETRFATFDSAKRFRTLQLDACASLSW